MVASLRKAGDEVKEGKAKGRFKMARMAAIQRADRTRHTSVDLLQDLADVGAVDVGHEVDPGVVWDCPLDISLNATNDRIVVFGCMFNSSHTTKHFKRIMRNLRPLVM